MKGPRWLVLIGGVVLLVGLLMALISAHFGDRVMGQAGLGVAVWAPEKGSAEWLAKERQRMIADGAFYIGLALTAFGVALQTVGSILPR